jgi:hypothetical protein
MDGWGHRDLPAEIRREFVRDRDNLKCPGCTRDDFHYAVKAPAGCRETGDQLFLVRR